MTFDDLMGRLDRPMFVVTAYDGVTRVARRPRPQEGQHATAELFGSLTGDEVDKLARCDWSDGPDGVPVLDDCLGWFAGRVLERHDAGDHTAHLVEVTSAGGGAGAAPLTFDDVRDLEPGHDA